MQSLFLVVVVGGGGSKNPKSIFFFSKSKIFDWSKKFFQSDRRSYGPPNPNFTDFMNILNDFLFFDVF